MKIVIHPAVDAERFDALKAEAPNAEWVNAATRAEALAAMPGTTAYLGKITPDLLSASDRLEWVQAFTVSLEHYMFPGLESHPCRLTNMRGLFSDVIADQVMGYILCFARNLHIYIRQQQQHRYEPVGGESARVDNAYGPGTVNAMDRATIFLPESNLGIVGLGAIGSEIAIRARAFGMAVRAVDRFPDRVSDPRIVQHVGGIEGLGELLVWSDFVVIAAPHTPETERLFNAKTIATMKPSAYLINIGRGAIVVLDDLVRALQQKTIAGAALDVYEVEPLPPDHPLWDEPNAILTPHTSGYSSKIASRHLDTLKFNVRRYVSGQRLRNEVDKSLWF